MTNLPKASTNSRAKCEAPLKKSLPLYHWQTTVMTLEQFRSLDLDKRIEAVWEWGFYVSRNKTENINKVLYSIHGFFAEMILSLENNSILDVKGLEQSVELQKEGFFIKNTNPFFQIIAKGLPNS